MKRSMSVPLLILLVVLFSASPAIAGMVEHHGSAVDAEGASGSCIACHDGSLAMDAAFCTVECSATTPHAIEKHYPPYGKEGSYASAAAVTAKGIRLMNGRVTCVSCHNLNNQVVYHLVLDEQGRLCKICHLRE